MPSVSKLRINGVEYDLNGGSGGTSNYNDLSNKPQINGNELSGNKTSAQLGLASSSDIPTNVSELTNDSGYITGLTILTYNVSTWQDFIDAFNSNKVVYCRVPNGNNYRYAFLAYYNSSEHSAEFQYYRSIKNHSYATQYDEIYIYTLTQNNSWTTGTRWNSTPTKVDNTGNFSSGLEISFYNYENHIRLKKSVDDLTNYYLKTETYTKTEVDNLIAGISTISFEVVQTLPQTGESNVIYLVPKSTAQTNNTYDEYIYTNNAWEKIGDTEIDLSNYYTKSETYSKTQVDTALNGKVDKESGKGLSTNDYTTAEKNKLNGIASGAEVNVQSDWNQTTTTADDYIKNKPQNLVQDASYVHTDNNYSNTEKSKVTNAYKSDDTTDDTNFGADADKIPYYDASATTKKNVTWSKIKTLLGTIFAPLSHTHGNIQNGGTLQTTDVTIANGDKLVVTDSSDSNKVARTSVSFDGSTTTKALTPKGTFETFLQTHQNISGKLDKNTAGGIASCAGNGQYRYCKIAIINITGSYLNYPLVFEISGRGRLFSTIQVMFANTNTADPALSYFISDNSNAFYIKKTATSTWEIYGEYSELWGTYCLHRITGTGANIVASITMSNLSELPSDCTQVTYGGNCNYANSAGYANNAGSVGWASVMGKTNASSSSDGLMSASDKTKLDGIQPSADAVSWTPNLSSGNISGVLNINGINYNVYYERYTAESPWTEYEMTASRTSSDVLRGTTTFSATSNNIHADSTVEILSNNPTALYYSLLIEEGKVTVGYRNAYVINNMIVKARVS